MGGDSGGRLHAFRSLAGNRALVRVLAGYALFVLTEYSAWIAILVFARFEHRAVRGAPWRVWGFDSVIAS